MYTNQDIKRSVDEKGITYYYIGDINFYLTPLKFFGDQICLSFSHPVELENNTSSRIDIVRSDGDEAVSDNSTLSYGISSRPKPKSQAQRLMQQVDSLDGVYGPYEVLSDRSGLDPCIKFYVVEDPAKRRLTSIISSDEDTKKYLVTIQKVELAIANFFAKEDSEKNS